MRVLTLVAALLIATLSAKAQQTPDLASTPPMGWNILGLLRLQHRRTAVPRLRAVGRGAPEARRLSLRHHRSGMVRHRSHNHRRRQGRAPSDGSVRPVHPRPKPLPFERRRPGIRALGRLHPLARPSVRHPHRAGDSARGGRSQHAHRRLQLPRQGRRRHLGRLPVEPPKIGTCRMPKPDRPGTTP